MLKDLEIRKEYWNWNYSAFQQGDSPPLPFSDYLSYFDNKDILEIGPGGGRQYAYMVGRSKSYSVADISEYVLLNYNTINNFLITDYAINFKMKFEVIHFWYVLHHILKEELSLFVDFLDRHLHLGGFILFNTPYLDFHEGTYGENGILTTNFTLEDIEKEFCRKFEITVRDKSKYGKSNGYIIVAKKEF